MTTIPLKDDAPDWERMFKDAEYSLRQCGYTALHPDQIRIGYIAALERCARWHEAEGVYDREGSNIQRDDCNYYSAELSLRRSMFHEQGAIAIRRWIEKEKANGMG